MTAASPSQQGMLAIWHDVAAGREEEVRDWYRQEHHFERLAIPGFLEARRFDRVDGDAARVLGLYRVVAPSVLRSAEYLAAVASPSERTRATMPHFRGMCRTVCRVAATAGRAEGGHVATLAAADGELDDPAAACSRVLGVAGVLRVEAIVAVESPPSSSAEATLRGGVDARIAWALVIDADSMGAAQASLAVARIHTGASHSHSGVYRLAFAARSTS